MNFVRVDGTARFPPRSTNYEEAAIVSNALEKQLIHDGRVKYIMSASSRDGVDVGKY